MNRSHQAPWIVSNSNGSSAAAIASTAAAGSGIRFGYEYMKPT